MKKRKVRVKKIQNWWKSEKKKMMDVRKGRSESLISYKINKRATYVVRLPSDGGKGRIN
ncbi:MAG: hypothetical protein ABIG28_01060 [archaeon]